MEGSDMYIAFKNQNNTTLSYRIGNAYGAPTHQTTPNFLQIQPPLMVELMFNSMHTFAFQTQVSDAKKMNGISFDPCLIILRNDDVFVGWKSYCTK